MPGFLCVCVCTVLSVLIYPWLDSCNLHHKQDTEQSQQPQRITSCCPFIVRPQPHNAVRKGLYFSQCRINGVA